MGLLLCSDVHANYDCLGESIQAVETLSVYGICVGIILKTL